MRAECDNHPAHAYIAPGTTVFHRHSGKSCFYGHGVIDEDYLRQFTRNSSKSQARMSPGRPRAPLRANPRLLAQFLRH